MMNRVRQSLSLKIFLILVFVIVLPINIVMLVMKGQFEDYISEEINTRITQTLKKSEDDLYETFDSLLNISNLLVVNENFRNIFTGDMDYYNKVKSFDNIISELSTIRLIRDDEIQVTFIDNKNDIYSNWSRNYNDYSSLIEQNWIKESTMMKGRIRWGVFSSPFIVEDDASIRYIGVARSVLSEFTKGDMIGTLVISMRQTSVSSVLEKYAYSEKDCVYVCDQSGAVVLRLDSENRILSEEESNISYILQGDSAVKTIHKSEYLISSYVLDSRWMLDGKTLSVHHFTEYETVTKQFNQLVSHINLIICFAGISIIVFIYFLSKKMIQPIILLSEQLKVYDMHLESSGTYLDVARNDEIGELNRAFYKMNENIVALFHTVKKEQKTKEQYRVNYLKAQLNPHFLFNTLTMIRWQAIFVHADNIVEAIDALGEMLQYSMGKGDEFVSLHDEIKNLEGYVKIQNTRYGRCYKIVNHIPEQMRSYKIIRFILQPVVENSIIHGFRNAEINGCIEIDAAIDADNLVITVSDNGIGLTQQQIAQMNDPRTVAYEEDKDIESRRFNKIGISNIRDQIRIRFGDQYGLEFGSRDGGGTKVVYKLPIVND